jgi:ribonuclease Y
MDPILMAIVALLVGGAGVYTYQNIIQPKLSKDKKAVSKSEKTEPDNAREVLIEAKDEALKIKREAEEEASKVRSEVLQLEARLAAKEENLDKKLSDIEQKENSFKNKEAEMEKTRTELATKLEKVASITREEAKKLIIDATESKLKDEVSRRIREAEEKIKREADDKAKSILVDAMKAGATDYVPEYTTSIVRLPDEDMKGRIIGREGRNIKAFEMATGVDVDLDDTPGTIRLSCFDGERREVAKIALERLMVDGRIQPTRIEEVVERVKKDFEKIRREEGEKLCNMAGVHNLPAELVDTLGRFKWRYSYGQSLFLHTLEETKIAVALAKEVGADANIVRMGCLFHDIGKVFTGEQEGSHVELGVEYLKKFNINPKVINAVAEHHEDKPFSSVESIIVYIADAISGSRPGARHEEVQDYIKRVTELENVASSFKGVDKSFAIAAGREVRVIVYPEQVDDAQLTVLANDISQKIHDTLTYPGTVKVTVMRETRAESVAK